ncbi:MAG: sensor histidine kinase [Psychroflexus halocasei]|uniref:sensor histidine kinase n=1 Tax=Psychroflexus sp. S27 TaxID=1982757 RepID=UPI000C2A530D|nr:HAMP domain-containing sensor histidine kinase [Psychroflexus sp. S27]PJX26940.1 two-component sensor histidine kinase [Psychroflexus sp. S27]
MKLFNRSLLYLTFAFFVIIGVWSILFYYNLKDEIRDSIDDGLENNKILIIEKLKFNPELLNQNEFGGNNFEIHPTSRQKALSTKDVYKDTLMYRINEDDLEPVRILHSAFENDGKYYRLKIISSLVEEDDLIEDSFWSIVWLFIILISSVIIINNFVLKKVWTPFYQILDALKKYRLDQNEKPIKISSNTKEFKELQKASNALIKHAKEAYHSQKQFTENASHELQTPLAVISTKLELLLESKDLTHNNANSIAEVIAMTNRIKQLNKSLLLLAKIENKQFIETEQISIQKIVKNHLSRVEDFIDFKNINIEFVYEKDIIVEMNSALAEILISNIINNAIFHNIENGQLQILLKENSLIISNTGNNKALIKENIYERFHKENQDSKNTGLGLSISKAICELYQVPIVYDFFESQHTFKINFKKNLAEA